MRLNFLYIVISIPWMLCGLLWGQLWGGEENPGYEYSRHAITVRGAKREYSAIQGTLPIVDKENKEKGSIFFVAYTMEPSPAKRRPVTFCFNGGPGSSSVWLHMGLLGPKKVRHVPIPNGVAPPYSYEENPYTLLTTTDLVFIDPISTGFSRAGPGEDAKQFHGVQEDIASLGSFIRKFLTEFHRWEDPKFLVGESYGTTRACGLALHLHDQDYIYLNGLVLISSALEFQTFSENQESHDLPYLLFFPTYSAAAWYHDKLKEKRPLLTLLKEAEDFAQNSLAKALFLGLRLPPEEKRALAEKMSRLIGIDADLIEKMDLRLTSDLYRRELLGKEGEICGRFDVRITGPLLKRDSLRSGYDPSFEALLGLYTATMNDYLDKELGVKRKDPYIILTDLSPWNYGSALKGFPSVTADLGEVMVKNPALRIFVASGLYDFATPYLGTRYSLDHLPVPASFSSRITSKTYEGGHMMYVEEKILSQMSQELADFFLSSEK